MKKPLDGRGQFSPLPNCCCFLQSLTGGQDTFSTQVQRQLSILRWFRDSVLMKHGTGRSFVRLYYRFSSLTVPRLRGVPAVGVFVGWLRGLFARIALACGR